MTVLEALAPESRLRADQSRRRNFTGIILLGPALAYLAIFAIYPLFYSLRLSFTDLTAAGGSGRWVGISNYRDLFQDPNFWNAAKNSAVLVTAAVALQIIIGTAGAMFFNLHLRGSWLIRGILVLPMLIAPIVVGVMWRALLNPDWGLINWALGKIGLGPVNWLGSTGMAMKTLVMVDVWQWSPFVLLIVYARLQALPQDVYEAAKVDGAGPWSTFRHITLPMLMPAILFAAVFRAVDAFRNFDLVYGLSYGGPDRSTTTLSFFAFQNGFEFQRYGYAAATAYVIVLILIAASTLLFRLVSLRADASR